MNRKIKKKEIRIDSSEGLDELHKKQQYESGFRFFCKQIWKELNQSIWGKCLIVLTIILIIFDTLIANKLNRIIEIVIYANFGLLYSYFLIRYYFDIKS